MNCVSTEIPGKENAVRSANPETEWTEEAVDGAFYDTWYYSTGTWEENTEEKYYLFHNKESRSNNIRFVPWNGAPNGSYADEVTLLDVNGTDAGALPLGRPCDFSEPREDITDPAEQARIDSFFRRFRIETVEHWSGEMGPPYSITVDFTVCGHGLDPVTGKCTVEMFLQYDETVKLNDEGDYKCVYESGRMYALVAGGTAGCVYLPEGKTAEDVVYINGSLPTIQLFGDNAWDTPGLEFGRGGKYWGYDDSGVCEVFLMKRIDSGSVSTGSSSIADTAFQPVRHNDIYYKDLETVRLVLIDPGASQSVKDYYTNLAASGSGIAVQEQAPGRVAFVHEGVKYVSCLFGVDIKVDSNNDLVVDNEDNDVENESEFLFWINNDNDWDKDTQLARDNINELIDGYFDLVDMAHLSIRYSFSSAPKNSKLFLSLIPIEGLTFN